MRAHWQLSMMAAAVLALTGCGASAMPGVALRPLAGPAASASSPLTEEETALLIELAEAAQEAIAHADATYATLKLNTAHGRKITPEKEPMLVEGLKPLVLRLEADSAEALSRLMEAGTPKMTYLARELYRLGPPAVDPTQPAITGEPRASDLLYRVAQYRVRFGFMLEYVNRKGILPVAATWKR